MLFEEKIKDLADDNHLSWIADTYHNMILKSYSVNTKMV